MQEDYVTITFHHVKRSKADEIMQSAKKLAPGTEYELGADDGPIIQDLVHNMKAPGRQRKRLSTRGCV